MRALQTGVLAALLAGAASAQPALPKAPRVALEAYLDGAPAYRLLPDSAFFDRSGVGGELAALAAGTSPYWRVGDFDGDGIPDVAAILFGPPAREQGTWGDRLTHEARVLVLRGQPDRTYRVATEQYVEIPATTAFLPPSSGALGWTVWETDTAARLRPDGDGDRVAAPADE